MIRLRQLSRYRLRLRFAMAVALLAFACPHDALAQQTRPLPVEDALGVRSFGELAPARFSPDGSKFAYTVKDHQRIRSVNFFDAYLQTGVPPWGIGADIFVLDVGSGESRNITGGVGDNWLPAWSPDGRSLAFLSDREQSQARLWIWDAVRDRLRKVSDNNIRANDIVWTPDSRKVLISAAPEQLGNRQALKESHVLAQQDSTPGKHSDSTVVLYSSGVGSLDGKRRPISDPWDLDVWLRDLVVINVSDGSSKPIVQGGRIAQYRISPDGRKVAYTVPKRFEKAGIPQVLFDLAVVDIDTHENRILESDVRLDYDGEAFNWSPEGSRLAFRTGGSGERASDCFVVRADGGGTRNVSGFPVSETAATHYAGIPFWDEDGAHVYFRRDGALWLSSVEGKRAEKVAEIPHRTIERVMARSGSLWTSPDHQAIVVTHDDSGKQDGFYKIDLKQGTDSKLMEKEQCYTCAHIHEWQFANVTQDGQIAFYAEDAQHSPDLWVSDSSFQTVRRLTHLNPQFDEVSLGAARLIEWRDSDGESLKGALLLPSSYESGKRYPLIVWVYGGAFLSNELDHFGLGSEGPFNMQLFATRGYAVLMPDAPQHMGTPMTDLAKAVLPGVNKVIEMGIADPDQLGVMGQSWGSYSTLSLIVQTKRFKAAIAADGMGDLISAYGQLGKDGDTYGIGVVEGGQGLMGGTPWQFRERYIENSPVFYLDRVATPLLLVHGAEDRAVASFLSDEMFVGLRRLGKEVEYAKYMGEDHSPQYWSYANQMDLADRMIAWFDDHLKKPANSISATPNRN